MKNLLQIGVTGGIGSGKSVVTRIFSCLGIPVYDADSHAKKLMTTDGILIAGIREEFGTLSYDAAGSLDSRYIASQVFNDPERLKRLNRLVHPRVFQDYEIWLGAQRSQTVPYVVKEAALMLDSGAPLPDRVVVVTAPEALRVERVMARDGRDPEQVRQIIARQLSEEQMTAKADAVIINDENSLLIPQVLELHRVFSGLANERNSA
ncbi:MAG: dephospho-CoA kinase [Bacteroidota bacterium]